MVSYGSDELISSSEFAKKFGSYLLQIKNKDVEKLAVLKNNKVEAVLISKEEYESMKIAVMSMESQKDRYSIDEEVSLEVKKKVEKTILNELNKQKGR